MEGPIHTPDQAKWHRQLSNLLSEHLDNGSGNRDDGTEDSSQSLRNVMGSGSGAFRSLDKDLAWQEYLANGQQGLDGLLAIMSGEV